MKTKKSADFVKEALKRSRTKFAVVGKGTSWTIFDGTDLAKAAAAPDETLIKASCQRKDKVLAMIVVGGSPEVKILKEKIFNSQLKADAKAMTFKPVNDQENAELELLLAELQSTLVEQVGKLPSPQREETLPVYNQALELATDGELAGAKAKVAELKSKLSGGGSPEDAERKQLIAELQGPLVEQVGALAVAPLRQALAEIVNEAMRLATGGGDLNLVKEKIAAVKEGLATGKPPRPKQAAPPKPGTPSPGFKPGAKPSGPPQGQTPTIGKKPVVPPTQPEDDPTAVPRKKIEELLTTIDQAMTRVVPELAVEMKKVRDLCQTFLNTRAGPKSDPAVIEKAYQALRSQFLAVGKQAASTGAIKPPTTPPQTPPTNPVVQPQQPQVQQPQPQQPQVQQPQQPLSPEEIKQEQIKTLKQEVNGLASNIKNPASQKKLIEAVKKLADADPAGPEAKMMEALKWEPTPTELKALQEHKVNGVPQPLNPKDCSFESRLVEVYKTLDDAGSDLMQKLTPGELVAIRSYTDDKPPIPAQYSQMNGALIGYFNPGDDKKKKKIEQMIAEATKALAKLDDHQTWPTKRGEGAWAPGDELQYVENTEFTIKSFWSTGTSFSGKWQISVFGATGKKISDASKFGASEQEVLFPPGTKFRVKKVVKSSDSLVNVTVEEV